MQQLINRMENYLIQGDGLAVEEKLQHYLYLRIIYVFPETRISVTQMTVFCRMFEGRLYTNVYPKSRYMEVIMEPSSTSLHNLLLQLK